MITYIRDILSVKNYNETNIITTNLHLASISNNTVILDQVTLDCLAEEKNSIQFLRELHLALRAIISVPCQQNKITSAASWLCPYKDL